ncbi:CbiQ family ECF transporter T component [Saccharothrix coeruleofusca]|uniref:Cobalt ABC transporter permease n=1 Tax=Saccharothrix coeruleofusca TaxID=33919 RepID=A0A918EGL6_9PSEU|nr:CbiQ family ECF transporter T component [Saccharothrix coeruleofusca]GGP82137.1 cobalt ABC transporter permease [Saccharothrix coeruleofusca]
MTRALHPGAWWLWALGLAVVAARTTNPLLLGLVLAVAGYVAVACAQDTPWASSYGVFLKFGLVVIALRVVFHVLLGGVQGPTVLFTLPQLPLWPPALRLGGPVSAEGLVFALVQGLQLATLLGCVGAVNAVANPKRLLRSLPAALYEVSVAVVVALTVAPQLAASARSVRRARRLRGDAIRGRGAVRTLLVPVLEGAFERSLSLAAAMDSRGYGRNAGLSRRARLLTAVLVLGGVIGLCVGVYALLDGSSAGVPVLLVGVLLAVAGLVAGSRRVRRSRYRPDRWRARELLVAASGAVAAMCAVLSGGPDMVVQTSPLSAPHLPALPAVGVLVGLLPSLVAAHRRSA